VRASQKERSVSNWRKRGASQRVNVNARHVEVMSLSSRSGRPCARTRRTVHAAWCLSQARAIGRDATPITGPRFVR